MVSYFAVMALQEPRHALALQNFRYFSLLCHPWHYKTFVTFVTFRLCYLSYYDTLTLVTLGISQHCTLLLVLCHHKILATFVTLAPHKNLLLLLLLLLLLPWHFKSNKLL